VANSYYVDVPEAVARACWDDFEHELNYPGAGLNVEFTADSPGRTRLDLHADDVGRTDAAARSFRLYLEGRGLIDATTGPSR